MKSQSMYTARRHPREAERQVSSSRRSRQHIAFDLFRRWSLALLLALLAGCGDNGEPGSEATTASETELSADEMSAEATEDASWQMGVTHELEWDDLIPADWQPETLMQAYDAENLTDDDPRAQELMDRLKDLWSEPPVVDGLDGHSVRLPGFVVPLETDATTISEFLLVPYFGACIHVPPPPANQTVLVTTQSDKPYEGGLFDTVWVEGRLRVTPFSNELGDAGYHIENAQVSLYEEP